MPASQQFSGTGNPNGVVDGNPGDTYQDETGKFWVNTAAPSTWVQVVSTATAVFVPGAGAGSAVQNNGSGNAAAGTNAIAEGNATSAGGFAAHAEGGNTVASGDFSHAEGSSATASNTYAHAEGSQTTASGQYSHAEGSLTQAQGDFSHAEGSLTIAQGDYSHAEGSQTHATGLYSHAGGSVSVAAGDNSLAHGDTATANGYASAAIGESCTATGEGSMALGAQSNALRTMQVAHAAGRFTANGDAQSSWVELRGSTPGAAPGESTELKFGFSPPTQTLQLEDGKGYTIDVQLIARGTVTGSPAVQSFKQSFSVRRDAGLTTIAASGALDQFGDAAAASWTFAASVGAAPDRLVLTFTTGATTSAARCVAKATLIEVLNP